MKPSDRVPLVLFILRITVFLVMFMWTLDKFIRPEHAATVYQHFYRLGGLGRAAMYTIGVLELALLIGFVLGVGTRLTYGAVLLLHPISTLSSYGQYLHPFQEANLLFFAGWPMLGACFALYSLRDLDTCWRISGTSKAA